MLTQQDVAKALPANMKNVATQALTDHINNVVTDPEIAEHVRNNFISYAHVMRDGKFKIEDYLNAVMYVSYKLMGKTNHEAYALTFPQRYATHMANGVSQKDISSYVSVYNKGKLVNLVMEQSIIPTWVLNQDIFQKAVNTQLEIMTDPEVSPKVRSDAANSIMTHLKKPEGKDFQVSLRVEESSGMTEMREHMTKLAQQQRELLEAGVGIKTITDARIIEQESTDG